MEVFPFNIWSFGTCCEWMVGEFGTLSNTMGYSAYKKASIKM